MKKKKTSLPRIIQDECNNIVLFVGWKLLLSFKEVKVNALGIV